MQRLYKFFFLLFLVIFIVSFTYGSGIAWVSYKVIQTRTESNFSIGNSPFSTFLRIGFIQAISYSLILFLGIISLFRKSLRYKQKFTLRYIINVILLFFAVTTIVFVIHLLFFSYSFSLLTLYMLIGPNFGLPFTIWFPYLLAWLILFLILASRIKKAE